MRYLSTKLESALVLRKCCALDLWVSLACCIRVLHSHIGFTCCHHVLLSRVDLTCTTNFLLSTVALVCCIHVMYLRVAFTGCIHVLRWLVASTPASTLLWFNPESSYILPSLIIHTSSLTNASIYGCPIPSYCYVIIYAVAPLAIAPDVLYSCWRPRFRCVRPIYSNYSARNPTQIFILFSWLSSILTPWKGHHKWP